VRKTEQWWVKVRNVVTTLALFSERIATFDGCEKLFRYHVSDQEFEKFSSEFLGKKKAFPGPSGI
jgi:hypothetical protein